MSTLNRRTVQTTTQQALDDRKWHVVDVAGLTLGRAATQIAHILRGKHKPSYTPNVDCGDFVVVLNAQKVVLTGNKTNDKLYYRHTLFMGGLKTRPAKEMIATRSPEVIERAVWGMLPKGPLGRDIIKKLKVYAGTEHPHAAQQPVAKTLRTMRA
ncbi:MAG TPA: 50S ribosomal protein L13 [Pseudomonadota bacterium]|jgi:large subunit ribosomal protein L13|nr:50S ribosomal protein L13 [Pseudomonadota bacterium]